MIKIAEKWFQVIDTIFSENFSDKFSHIQAKAFGSRVNGTNKEYSDLDIVLITTENIDHVTLWKVKSDFEESDLPFRIDLHDWNKITKNMKENILTNISEVIWELKK